MPSVDGSAVRKLVVACDAGMGSSLMLAGTLKKQLKGTLVSVVHTPVAQIPSDADLVVCHVGLAERARQVYPNGVIVSFRLFIGDPAVTRVVKAIINGDQIDG
jgi:mannitol-specific phosphotransferase system IIBC component